MAKRLTKEQIGGPLKALASEGSTWQLEIALAEEDGRPVQIGKLATGKYFVREISTSKKRAGIAKPLPRKQALELREGFDEVYAFRRKLSAGLLGSVVGNKSIKQSDEVGVYGFAETVRTDVSRTIPVHYHLRITPEGEFFLTHDSDLYGTRTQEFSDVTIETSYTYHVCPETNQVGRVIYTPGQKPPVQYRHQDEPYTDYFAHVISNLKPFDITIAA